MSPGGLTAVMGRLAAGPGHAPCGPSPGVGASVPDRAPLRREVREIYDEHVRLLSLVRGRKAAQAEAHWRRHIEVLGRYLPSDADRTSIDVLG